MATPPTSHGARNTGGPATTTGGDPMQDRKIVDSLHDAGTGDGHITQEAKGVADLGSANNEGATSSDATLFVPTTSD